MIEKNHVREEGVMTKGNKADETAENVGENSLAMELLLELKDTTKRLFRALVITIATLAIIVIAFLTYLVQWDFVVEHTVEAEARGITALVAVDQSGNFVGQEMTQEMLELFIEWIGTYGES